MFNPKNINEEIILNIYRISRAMRKQGVNQSADHDELSTLQLQTLLDISMQKRITMGNLSEKLYVALPTATVLVNKLVKAGLVKRNIDSKDRRIITLTLTEKGSETLEKSLSLKFEKMNSLLKNVSKEDRVLLKKILVNLLSTLDGN